MKILIQVNLGAAIMKKKMPYSFCPWNCIKCANTYVATQIHFPVDALEQNSAV